MASAPGSPKWGIQQGDPHNCATEPCTVHNCAGRGMHAHTLGFIKPKIHVACRASMPESSSPTLPTLLIDHEAVLGCAATLHPASCVHVTCVGMCQLCCSYLTGRYTTAIVSAV